jgi:argininosuccinate synthase
MKYESIEKNYSNYKKTGNKEKIVLAYSGGLDTSVILTWLIEKGYNVYCFVGDVGQNENFEVVKNKALTCGATQCYIADLKEKMITDYFYTALKCNAIYEGKYLLGTAIARPIIAKGLAEYAKEIGAKIISHGATGKGNDQIRFEQGIISVMPEVSILSPWKDPVFLSEFKGRIDMINYAKEKNILISATLKKPFSMDDNLIHISYESGILEDPMKKPEKEMFKMTVDPKDAPDKETIISIEFKEGIPVCVSSIKNEFETKQNKITGDLNIINYLNKVAGENGIGRIDLVENRVVGLKSRGVYETPAYTVLLSAHKDIEGLTLDKGICHIRDSLMPKISELMYNGLWLSPEMKCLKVFIDKTQENVSGTVYLELYKGNVTVVGRESDKSLYNPHDASMDEFGNYDQEDAKGFIKINSLRLFYHAKQYNEN